MESANNYCEIFVNYITSQGNEEKKEDETTGNLALWKQAQQKEE